MNTHHHFLLLCCCFMVSLPDSRPLFLAPGVSTSDCRLRRSASSVPALKPNAQGRPSQPGTRSEAEVTAMDMLEYTVICYSFPYYTVLHCALHYRTLPYPALPCDAMLCCVVPCCAVSCCAMLCLLYYTMLYDTMLDPTVRHDAA